MTLFLKLIIYVFDMFFEQEIFIDFFVPFLTELRIRIELMLDFVISSFTFASENLLFYFLVAFLNLALFALADSNYDDQEQFRLKYVV